jgi:hypothetical protein
MVNVDSKSENARDLHERVCDFSPTLHKLDSKLGVTAENNVIVFNTGVPAPIPDNYYTVQEVPAL